MEDVAVEDGERIVHDRVRDPSEHPSEVKVVAADRSLRFAGSRRVATSSPWPAPHREPPRPRALSSRPVPVHDHEVALPFRIDCDESDRRAGELLFLDSERRDGTEGRQPVIAKHETFADRIMDLDPVVLCARVAGAHGDA